MYGCEGCSPHLSNTVTVFLLLIHFASFFGKIGPFSSSTLDGKTNHLRHQLSDKSEVKHFIKRDYKHLCCCDITSV